ncbi:Mitochondrial inner membrane translocase subunit Tim17/Tim22/Tim23/peroxisomal protein PMP24 [Cynara cardunculus var. scolymus]|uniref:Mitochondrial inner membrane translocase subunit Tim17/Tim22/Tim23/peroxisomal protein PMP24 n=1 Tax=Cynara cardunculus var. scolymus TaxID=59895 RepID=A0A103YMU1_CYNCS|nr:Mitochondrial inner membrane translocase subunit Tim17/Tim22/Tim23/peroxisomal protein PMP24 [Cynara cardunculus var. scolymus]
MPRTSFAGSLSSPKVDVVIDTGNHLLNHTVDGFLKIGTVAAAKTAVEETFHVVRRGFLVSILNPFLVLLPHLFILVKYISWHLIVSLDLHFSGSVSKHNLEDALKKMCKEGAYWGTVAGVYVGMEYGIERVRGTRDWKNAMIGGALTGALISAVSSNKGDKIITDAITGGAVATAAEFLNYLT